ncbi:MAG: aminotransferase class I/II-fold pyridoxal phosphate-dependent enzyme [Defluviitaleaceae bacterium]|nr:aminotransferase class I/II-fold pyridoxal phosphate-dependent enzyme [Defluviitaleaceae bacterium]
MSSFVTDKVKNMPASGIRKFFDVAAEMKDIISLGVGEPDFFTPWNVREEAIYSLERRRTAYTSNAGHPALREAICEYMRTRFQLKYSAKEEIIVTVGVSEAIDIALRAVINPGDEVLIIEPCYVSYRACVILAGGVPVTVPTDEENNFRVQAEDIRSRITPRTKAIMLCYPNNPTGAIMERDDLEKICTVLRDHEDILVISDEVYAELTYTDENKHISIATMPGMYERTLVLNGFSKAFAMTGWRLGYACGPAELIAGMVKIHQYVIMCAPTTAQIAGIEALKNGLEGVQKMRDEYNDRRRLMVESFREIGISCFEPLGAFYLFPSIKKTGLTSEDFCTRMLMEKRLAVVPGTAFGECGEGFIRCSYAYSVEELKEAVQRIKDFVLHSTDFHGGIV